MSIALSDLAGELQELVPAQDGTPSSKQYQNAIKSAVADFSDRTGMIRIHEINVVADTAVYALPADFLKEIEMSSIYGSGVLSGNKLITSSGIIRLGESYEEEVLYAGQTATFYPTPRSNITRTLKYKAGHVLDENGNYPYMTEQMADIIMLKAQAIAWRMVGARTGRTGWRYSFGDVTIDKTNLGKSMQTWIMDFDHDYDKRVNKFIGTVGSLG